MIALAIKLLLAYLVGSIVGSLVLGHLRGIDIRKAGSGNAGATNAFRTQGWTFALMVAAIDVGKGALAALVIARLDLFGQTPVAMSQASVGLACALAAAVGHCYPVWHGFRGGKAAGTLFGGVLALSAWLALAMLAVLLLVLASTGYVGLASVMAAVSFPIILLLTPLRADAALVLVAVAAAALLVWKHRANLARLRAGSEPRFQRARVLARLFARRKR